MLQEIRNTNLVNCIGAKIGIMIFKSNCYFNNCAGTLTMCDTPFNATGLVAWRQVTYLDTITLPEPCGLWKFSRGTISPGNYRDPMITNIAPNTHTYYYEAILHADSTLPNSSAVWQRPMFMYAYENEPTQWHLPITDPDGDSLVYSHVAPRRRIDTLGMQQVILGSEDTVLIYTGQAMNLCSKYYSSPGAALKHQSNLSAALLNNASYSVNTIGNGDSLLTCLQWTPTLADTGVYLAITTITDTSCTLVGPQIPQDYFHRIIVKKNQVGVASLEAEKRWVLYPNPAQHCIYVNLPKRTAFSIYSALGQLVRQGVSSEALQTRIELQAFQNGVCTIRFEGSSIGFSVVK